MNNNLFIKQLDAILAKYSVIKGKAKYEDLSGNTTVEEIIGLTSMAKAAVARIAGNSSEYYKDIDRNINRTDINAGYILKYVIGTIEALKSDLENDFLKTFRDLVQSEVFSDYLEMADYLEQEGFIGPAAVIIGSTLETHLRELCKSNSIDVEFLNSKGKLVPKKADVLNADLAKSALYSSAYQKQIIAWFGIRNSAAHGKYDEYTQAEVKLMLQGVKQFILTTK